MASLSSSPRNKEAGLHGLEFTASCPPDVSPRTRIVAVCGITDFDNIASPSKDGWFLSDFWMFNHLLRGAPVVNQIWLTCCNPKLLVDRYGSYAHGNPLQERRVVLEERLLGAIETAGTLRVVEPKILLERFLETVQQECEAAVKANQEVLLLIFGHGDGENYGVTIGSSSNTEFTLTASPQLKINRLKAAVGEKTKCTLLMTSCYSSGWTMQPDLNLTVIAAAGPAAKSQSWNSRSSRGFSGPNVASAICHAISASEIQDEENIGGPGTTYDEEKVRETYAEMGRFIYDHLKRSDRFHSHHQISFAAQDDEWTKVWRERIGIPLAFFKEKWEELSVLPARTDSLALADTSLYETRTGSAMPSTLTMTTPQIYNVVRSLAMGYARSFPGVNNVSINTAFHTEVRLLLSGEERFENQMNRLLRLGYTLIYRLEGMARATNYKDFLQLEHLDCEAFNVEAWLYPLYESNQQDAIEKVAQFDKIKSLILAAKIFSAAPAGLAWYYDKPDEYLAIAFIESYRTMNEVDDAISALKDRYTAILAPKVEAIRRERWFRDGADQILKPRQEDLAIDVAE